MTVVTPSPVGVVGAGDAERVAQAEVQDLVGQVQAHAGTTHGRASTRSRIGRPEPVGPEPDRVVGREPGLGGRSPR